MAQETCCSSSSSNQTWSYEVFVSFYGKDTRFSFTDHLFDALDGSGIHNFRDNRDIEGGEAIWTELEKGIESSRIAIIVFSRNYAASRWCLDELVKIMECKQGLQQMVLPVFYDVDPSDVRNQKGSLEIAFASHEKRFEKGKVARWRAALTEAANLSGVDLQNAEHRFESRFIRKIIEDVFYKLNKFAHLVVAPYPVGIESRLQELVKKLSSGSSDVRMVGIWGMSGIGKTTIAKAIYNQLQRKFEASCFLKNVSENSKRPNGLINLQEQILSSVHVSYNRKIKVDDEGTLIIKNIAWCKRVLVVLDDVDHRDQLDKLAIRRGNFQPGSLIIITTRNKSMLKLAEINEIYTPPALDYHESLQLLSWHAFRKGHPTGNYVELSKEVVYYARGLPLALEVLGSFLSGKRTTEWKGTLENLRVIPHDEIQEKLMVSLHSLSKMGKKLFLDIACFCVGMEKNYAFQILQDSNLVLESELGVLVRLCLVTIDCSNQLTMHDMIRDMGREVARRECSRLCNRKDVLDVLELDEGTKVVEGIMTNLSGDLPVDAKAFAKMHQLRVLKLNYAHLKGNFQCPSKRLRYLEWYGFPMESIPADLYMENLIALYMPHSSLIELWTGPKILKRLKFLDVSHSYHLRRTPDFSGIDNLEVLLLNNCTNLVEVHESVIFLDKLVTLDLEDCNNLRKIPLGIYNLKSRVYLSGCTKLDMVPRLESPFTVRDSLLISSEVPLRNFLLQYKDFTINGSLIATAISSVPGDRKSSKSLAIHPPQPSLDPNLSGVHDLEVDAIVIPKMDRLLKSNYARFKGNFPFNSKRLIYLEWYGFPMESIPADLYMENLIDLYMPHSSLIELWTGPKNLKRLKFLDVSHSFNLRRTPDFSGVDNLEVLLLNNCTNLVEVHESVIYLDKLVTLNLYDCNNLRKLPPGIRNLKSHVYLPCCTKLDMVPRLESPFTIRDSLVLSSVDGNSSLRLNPEMLELEARHDGTRHPRGLNLGPVFASVYQFLLRLPWLRSYIRPNILLLLRVDFLNRLTIVNLRLCERFKSLDELPISLKAMDANNTISLEWIIAGSNWKLSKQLECFGSSKLLQKNPTGNPRKNLIKELIATDSVSVFLPGGEFPDWFDYKSTGSILSFDVPPLVKQKIRGWFICVVFASCFHDIHGFTALCKFKNRTKGIEWQYQQKNCRVIPCQEHMWLQSVPLHDMANLLEAGDEVDYSIRISGGFQVKKFGVNLTYENDTKKDCHSYFEAMVENASLPYKDDFLDEDVSTDQAMAGDKKINPSDVQQSRFDDKEDVSIAQHCELTTTNLEDPTLVPEDRSALLEVEDRPSKGNGRHSWSYFHENQPGTMFFEEGASFEQNQCSSGISRMNFVSQIERLRSLEAEYQLLHHQLIDTARTSSQHIAALESENLCLRMELARAKQFAPRLYMDLPRPHFSSNSASSSSSAFTQPTIAAITPVASMRINNIGLDYTNFLARPALGFQSVNYPSGSTPPNGDSHLPQ